MNCPIAITSSTVNGIMTSMTAAAARHSVHQKPTTTGCKITSVTCVKPSGTTRMKKNTTIHGIVRQRVRPPIHAIKNSSV